MTVTEFRDLTAGVFDAITSFRGCCHDEKEAELCRVQLWVSWLRDSQWPKRLSDRDRQRGLLAFKKSGECVAEFLEIV